MPATIDSQTWAMIDQMNASLQTERKHRKEGEARVAQENSGTRTLSGLQQITKDIVLPSDPNLKNALTQAKTPGGAPNKPNLPNPNAAWNGFQNAGEHVPGLISIMGSVLCMQAKTNSNFWSTLWKQASDSMQMEAKFAPIIGKAINDSYSAQAAQTQSQADQAKQEGIISMVMFAGSVAMGAFMDITDEENPLNQDKDEIGIKNETTENPGAANRAAGMDEEDIELGTINQNENPEEETENLNRSTSKELTKENESWKARAKRYWNIFKNGASRGQKRFSSILGKTMQASMMMSMLSDGVTKYFVTAKYQTEQVGYIAQEGGCQAVSKEAEQYAQFYGQDFSRSEDLRQGASQNLDYAMNILKSAVDSITQTVTSMFRG